MSPYPEDQSWAAAVLVVFRNRKRLLTQSQRRGKITRLETGMEVPPVNHEDLIEDEVPGTLGGRHPDGPVARGNNAAAVGYDIWEVCNACGCRRVIR